MSEYGNDTSYICKSIGECSEILESIKALLHTQALANLSAQVDIKRFSEKADPVKFIQLGSQLWINVLLIEFLEKLDNGDYDIHMPSKQTFTVSDRVGDEIVATIEGGNN